MTQTANRRTITLAVILILVIFIGCAGCSLLTPKNDAGFLKNLAKGLVYRWDLSTKDSGDFSSAAEKRQYLNELVNRELEMLGDYDAYRFADEHLADLAKQYYEALDAQIKGIQNYGIDDEEYAKYYENKGYDARVKIISTLFDEYGLDVGKSYAEQLDEFVMKGRLLFEDERVLLSITEAINTGFTLESLGGSQYEMVIENTSEYDVSEAVLNFQFLDEDGLVTDTATNYLQEWPSGSRNKISVYTNAEFTHVELMLDYLGRSGNRMATAYIPIQYVNNMQVDISVKGLPMDISYSSTRGVCYTICTVSDMSSEESYWNNGKTSVILKLTGTKTYDLKGESYSRACRIGWKLYDQNGTVIDSGTCWTSDIKVGETFESNSIYTTELAPGSYLLELLNIS